MSFKIFLKQVSPVVQRRELERTLDLFSAAIAPLSSGDVSDGLELKPDFSTGGSIL
jgi:hypothetical protein